MSYFNLIDGHHTDISYRFELKFGKNKLTFKHKFNN